ncbi:MAG: BREX system Lon protease-like protein BrxL [Actinomyces graevenitzii]|uniref:BREX system Lon protease-like protein BrxL n=1 Tax=Actinomyces graevenitzii TaxID=55565 RepID=A0A9E7AIB0_9ACTO|nr:BREX system Lon protease-like protein BrxL [Actinomyces graevenitzii]UQF79134.1 MAG: BREX system Lon protease-like protein BrxL [Actinomyces graevenitzii]
MSIPPEETVERVDSQASFPVEDGKRGVLAGYEETAARAFDGFVVRKDLVGQVKGNAIVPSYVLEFLLAQYCATTSESAIIEGVESVRRILARHYVNRGDSELIKSRIYEAGQYRIIDKVSVTLDDIHDRYSATFENLGITNALVSDATVRENDRLLTGGVWCIAEMSYVSTGDTGAKATSPWIVSRLQAIQLPRFDFDRYCRGRASFSADQWIDLLVASVGLDPAKLSRRAKLFQLTRLVPYVERNYNLVELGPKGTGKSHIYSEFSPHGILVSGGEVTLAKLFVNNATRRIGLVGYWDVVAFDEFAGRKRVERSLVDTLKNYLANKSFSRGDSTITAEASMVFVGNTTRTVPAMLATADLFEALPEAYHDTAYMDRIHYYLPGWEVDIVRPELFSRGYGLIVDYLAEALRHLRTLDYSGDLDTLATLDPAMSKRDQDAVRKTFSGLAKLIFPARDGAPEELEELLRFAIEGRKRVKDQIIRLDDTMAASGSHFTYMLGRVDQDHYDAARACMVPTQEELDYPQYFTSHSDADERRSGQRGGEELSDGLPKSDGVVNASGDSRPASPVFDRRALLKARAIPVRYKIEPSRGHSMPGILLPYLFDAAEIQIRDPYLRKPYQIRNVHEILLLLIQHADAARLPHVVIETCASDEDEYRAKQEATFEQLQQSWGQFGIVIDWSIVDNFHDRSIVTDTGWVIDLGRGLDVYESFTWSSPFDPRITLPHLRRTKEITINVSRDTEGHA